MIKKLVTEFKNPSNIYRSKPFWAWNGKLEKSELIRQIRIMREMGFGGFFMHSRTGLATPYLGQEWFEMIETCCDEAEKYGMEAWLYDEDRWPSGSAGGLATKDKCYRQKRLEMKIVPVDEFEWSEKLLCAFTARLEGSNAYEVTNFLPGHATAVTDSKYVALVFEIKTGEESAWYNGQTYLDTLSPKAVQHFISITHDEYKRRFSDRLGNVIKGIFTDEPNVNPYPETDRLSLHGIAEVGAVFHVPWTDDLASGFKQRYGYDILEKLPGLFFDVDGEPVQQVRHHYHDFKTFLFTSSFAGQIHEWCKENQLQFTGHVLFESPVSKNASVSGSAMRFYEHMHMPGIDILSDCHEQGDYRPEYDIPKQCSSVQRQCGQKWMLSELYGCTGWDFSFEGHKAVGDWQTALGVNVRCPHLSWYTMEGEAKRDFPASISYQSPWWKLYRHVEDYFARLNSVMSCGSAVRRLLVLHPVESMWQELKVGWNNNREYRKLDAQFVDLRECLLAGKIDFDYADEDILSRLGFVKKKNGKIELVVGKASYDVLLIPPVITVRSDTLILIEEFRRGGGKVVFIGDPPDYVDAVKNNGAAEVAGRCDRISFEPTKIIKAVESARVLSITGPGVQDSNPILYLLHEDEKGFYLFLCNPDRENSYENMTVELKLGKGELCVEEWDAETGKRYSANFEKNDEKICIKTFFPPSGSRLFVVPKQKTEVLEKRNIFSIVREKKIEDSWAYSLSESNVMVLDIAQFRIDGGQWQGPSEVLKIDRTVRHFCGAAYRSGKMLQPWVSNGTDGKKLCSLEMSFKFKINIVPKGPVYLAVERPERFKISLNGREICHEDDLGWWTDKSLRLIGLDCCQLIKGTNTLNVSLDYRDDDGLEAMFLLGDFGVDMVGGIPVISKLREELSVGNWVNQGLSFYSGCVSYRKRICVERVKGERVFLVLRKIAGTCCQILINDELVKTIGWLPYEADITDFVSDDQAELTVRVYSHRRNSFGPLHIVGDGGRKGWTGPAQFITTGEQWQDEYHLVPCGLLEQPVLSYRTIK